MTEAALIGRYWPGESVLHRMDPRAKLTLTILLIAIIFSAHTFYGLAFCAIGMLALFILARIPFSQALRSILPLSFIIIFTVLMNVFFIQNDEVIAQWGPFTISEGGLYSAAFLGVRLLLLLLVASLLTLTTTTLDMTDGFDYMLRPFSRIGLPTHELSMIMGIALRFVPQFGIEFKILRQAQTSRGAQLSFNPFKGGLRTLGSLTVPLFTSAFRHADTLANAMDARCYHGGVGRTKLIPLRFSMLDLWATIICVVALALVVVSNFVF